MTVILSNCAVLSIVQFISIEVHTFSPILFEVDIVAGRCWGWVSL